MRTILTRGWYVVVGGVWLVPGETGSIQQYALECIMQGRQAEQQTMQSVDGQDTQSRRSE